MEKADINTPPAPIEVDTETLESLQGFQTYKVGSQMQAVFTLPASIAGEVLLCRFRYCFSVAISIQLQVFVLFFTPDYFNLINYTNNSCW